MVQQYDVAVFATIQDFLGGNFTAGPLRFDVGMDSIGYATSGGFIDDIVDELEDYKAQIKDGTIDVPDTP